MKIKKILTPFLAVGLLMAASCSRDNDDTTIPNNAVYKEASIDNVASEWKYFSFSQEKEITVTDPENDLTWDIAFQSFYVKVNGGTSGSGQGEVVNTNSKVFDDVKTSPTSGWEKDSMGTLLLGSYPNFTPQQASSSTLMSGGYQSTTGYLNLSPSNIGIWPSVFAPNEWVYIVKTADGKFAKIQVTNFYNDRGEGFYPKFKYQLSSNGNF